MEFIVVERRQRAATASGAAASAAAGEGMRWSKATAVTAEEEKRRLTRHRSVNPTLAG
jgi:hypothetical protein